MSEDSKQKAWLEHYQRLLNVEFEWDPDHLSYQSPVEGPPIPITIDMVKKAISQMKAGKAPGPSGIVVEMIFFFFFFFDLGFTALSRIFHLYRADRSSKVGENRSTRRKTT